MFGKQQSDENLSVRQIDVEQRGKYSGKIPYIISFLLIILIIAFFLPSSFTGKIILAFNPYANSQLLGNFYDAGWGEYYEGKYDIFVGGISKGHFNSALEACKILYPGSTIIYSSKMKGLIFSFSDRKGEKMSLNGYLNECYQ